MGTRLGQTISDICFQFIQYVYSLYIVYVDIYIYSMPDRHKIHIQFPSLFLAS